MTDDIDWKQKTREVAEWLGEVRDGIFHSYKLAHHAWHTSIDDQQHWPAYELDDAFAWRLLCAVDERRMVVRIGCDQDGNEVWSHGDRRTVMNGLEGKWEAAPSRKHALVLAACKLIDMGAEPREVAR